ncbi:MAG TPA: lipopolysaccharide biosynthesis protein [Candidatus Limnocylindrales bacterium]|nr:lipopolysaccharide biosynthesis protein [Candidatus Limnocylindrales bacterium]
MADAATTTGDVNDVTVSGDDGTGRRSGRAIIRSSLLSMLAIAALGITRLVHLSLVGRSMPEGDRRWAALVVLIGVTMTAGLFLPGGLASATSKFIPYHLGRGDVATATAIHRLISWVGYVGALVLAVIVGSLALLWYRVSGTDAFAVALLTFVFSAYSVEKAALYGFHRIDGYVRLELSGSALAILATVVVVVMGWTAVLTPLILGYSVLIVGAWVLLRRGSRKVIVKKPVPAADRKEIVGYVVMASIGGLAGAGLLQALPAIAHAYTSPVEVLYFGYAVSLVAPLSFLPRALSMALFPAMAHAQGAGDVAAVRKQADLTTRALFVLLAPLFAMAIMLARQVLGLVFGWQYTGGALVLQLLLAATFLMVTQLGAVNALSSGTPKQVRIPVTASVISGATGVAAAIPLGLALGGVGVALAYLLAASISASGPVSAVARQHELDWRGAILRSLAVVGAPILLWQGLEMLPFAGPVTDVAGALLAALMAVLVLRGDIRHILAGRLVRLPARWRGGSQA